MLDSYLRPYIDPVLNKVAHRLKQIPISPNTLTVAGFLCGLTGCVFAYSQLYFAALLFLIFNRLIDGFDGPLARVKNAESDLGGYLDIVLDFLIYAGFPFAFAIGIGTENALIAGAFILLSFMGTGTSFLAYAIICAKRGMETSHQGKKTFYFSNGLMEGTETILFLILICLWPAQFILFCAVFGSLCFLTTAQRIHMAVKTFQ
jgi:phosphatidylglycerophosphate synthase